MANSTREELLALAASMKIDVQSETTDGDLELRILNSKSLPTWLRERADTEGVILRPNVTFETAWAKVGDAIVKHKGYAAGMILSAQGVHVRIIALKYGGFLMIGGVKKVGDVWRPIEGHISTLYVTAFDDVLVVDQGDGSF